MHGQQNIKKNLKTTVLSEQHAVYGQQKKSIQQAVTFGNYVITTRIRKKKFPFSRRIPSEIH